MSRDVKNSHLDAADKPNLTKLADAVLFTPTPAHRKLKAKFWAKYIPLPSPTREITYDDAMQVTNDRRIQSLWGQAGFKEWFLNRDENRERLEYLFSLSLDTAEEILINPDMQPSAKVNMIKVLAELANKFPSRYQQDRFVDDDIQRMSEPQLRAWLEIRGVLPSASASTSTTTNSETINAEYSETKAEPSQETSDAKKDSTPG